MYEVIFSKIAKKQLKNLEKKTQIRILKNLKRIRIRPHSFIKKLIGSQWFSLRVGEWRIILDIKKDKILIYVIKIGNRKNIYK